MTKYIIKKKNRSNTRNIQKSNQ